MRVFRYILFYLFILIVLLLFFYSDNNKKKDYNYLINEEAIPIRDYDEIKGMKYTIKLDDSIDEKMFDVYSSILASIYHYKDFNSINNFFVNLEIDKDYKVEDIYVVDKNSDLIIDSLDYKKNKNDIVIYLDKDIFTNYNSNYSIKIKLKRNTRQV